MTEATVCATHPSVETYLRCSRCDKPICPRCLVQSPVGARCRDCARLRRLPVFLASPTDLARGLGAGLGTGLIGGALLAAAPFRFLHLLLVLGLGYLVGQAVWAATNHKRATPLAAIAAASTVIGLLLGPVLLLMAQAPAWRSPALLPSLIIAQLANPLGLLMMALAAWLAWRQVQ